MAAPLFLAALALTATPALSQAIQDSRCYLMNGGAVESFFISEDTPVGSIIGTLSVNGDPNDLNGDISLRIQEKNPPIALVPGTKNLTLLRELDREERLGPSSVYVNVRCDRRHTADPSFVVPVSVRVWDVNDNAPAWRGAPFRARVSELAAVGARVLAAPAADPDQPGPHAAVRYSVLPGPASEYVGFLSELDSTIVVKRPLDYETLRNFTVRLRAQDGGSPPRHNDTTLTVELLDADDHNPKFSAEHYVATVPRRAQEGTILETSPGPISAADQDTGINAPVYYSVSGEGADLVTLDRDSGALAATAALLRTTAPVTVVIKATQVDNPDRYALATVALRRDAPGAGAGVGATRAGVRFSRRAFSVSVPEDAPPGTVLAALSTRAADQVPLQFYVSERSFLEKFAINGAGEVLLRKPLDYEVEDSYRYQVMVTDGETNDTASVEISVQNVNEWEPRFRHAQYEFEARGAGALGRLLVHDGDRGDAVRLSLAGPGAEALEVSPSGELFLREGALAALNSTTLHVVATAQDSGSPPRQTSVPVVVRVPESLLGAHVWRAHASPLFAAFACALALLALLLLALLAYLCRLKRRRQVKDTSTVKSTTPEKPAALSVASGGSLQSVSAGASSILAASSTSLELPAGEGAARAAGGAAGGGAGALSDHLQGAAGRSGVAWPSATIPARVKHLSWDDAAQAAEERREVTETTNSAMAEHMNLTVYF
ncbi:protocadherin-like wing polarity protein stan isoform X2 [Vanessa cardui]|uniref:protocadherin-like wing polarity protein stan isoform X2 n=1 Tax=Vanessa cardui TaxID=171605 RepID=UPI001F143EF9|nr:protocadherin-like wing polarity protein stan isoform X2 [Vanessa cardui]